MLTWFCLAGAVALVVAHERLLPRGQTGRNPLVSARRLLLFAALVLAAAFGARAAFATRVQAAWQAWNEAPAPFTASGDPFLQDALRAQRPERPFPEGAGADEVRAWQAHVAERLRMRAGFVSATPSPIPIRILATEDVDTVRRSLLEFTSWDGTQIPAYLHQPRDAVNVPAVLVIPGHGDGIRATAGVQSPDYQHAAALELARRGYVTLTPELRGFGLLTPDGAPAHRAVAHAALVTGSFYQAIVLRDLNIALTVLQQAEGVDPARLAVAGTSLGGELAVFLGALDARARVILSHSHGGGIGPDETGAPVEDEARQTPHGCHTIPGINGILFREDWFRLLAPRALQVARGADDVGGRAKVFESLAMQAFDRLGASEHFEFSVHPGEHEFFVEPAARFLARWL